MAKEYTVEENKAWRAVQPQKMVVAKVVIKSDQERVLLAKPDYKRSWQLPGGGAEAGESPEQAAVREVKEELGLDISENDLQIKGTIYRRDEELLLVIYESTKKISENTKLTVQTNEITDFQFAVLADVAPLLSDYYLDFWTRKYL